MTSKGRFVMIFALLFLLILSLLYPDSMRIKNVKPDFILIFLIISATIFEYKAIVFCTVLSAVVRDLTEFHFPGPYLFTYIIIILLVYFASSFFYKPGILISMIFVGVFTLFHDVLWIVLYNVYFLLRFNIITSFDFGYNISNGTVYQILQNIIFGIVIYYLAVLVKRRVLNEKS